MTQTKQLRVSILTPDVNRSGGVGTLYKYAIPFFPDDVKFRFLDTRGKSTRPIGSIFKVIQVMATLLWQKITGDVDLVHINLGTRGSTVRKIILATWCRYFMRIPYVIQLHTSGFKPFFDSLPKLIQVFIVHILNESNRILALGEVWKRMLTEIGCNQDLIHVYVMGVPKIIPPVQPPVDTNKKDSHFYLLFAGDLAEWKGLHFLLEAMTLVKKDRFRLIVAGKGNIDYWRNLTKENNIEADVVFLGLVAPALIHTLMVLVDALILPSKAEGLPVCVLEALSAQTLVISSNTGSLGEFLTDGEGICFLPNIEPTSIATALEKVDGAEWIQSISGGIGRSAWETHFNSLKTTPKLSKHWHESIKGEFSTEQRDQ